MNCERDQTNIKNVFCGVGVVNEFVNAATIKFSTTKSIKELDVNMIIFKQQLNNQYKPFIMNTTVNFCSMVKNRKNNFLINMALESIREANIWKGCPLNGDYYINKFYFGPNPTKHLPIPGDLNVMKVQAFIKIYKTKKQVIM